MVVSIAGNITPTQAKRFVEEYLPYKKAVKKNQPLPYRELKTAKRSQVVYKKTEQAHLVMGVPSFGASHPDKYVAKILAAVLGGGMSSRLFTSVRERHGLAYYVRAQAQHYTDIGYLVTNAGVDVRRIDLAIKTILDEFREITRARVPASELDKAKEYLIGGLVLGLEHSDEIAYTFGMQELLRDKLEPVETMKRKLQAVTAEQVQRLARRLFTDNRLVLAVIGPYKDTKQVKKFYRI